jgi:hypothetical protein
MVAVLGTPIAVPPRNSNSTLVQISTRIVAVLLLSASKQDNTLTF